MRRTDRRYLGDVGQQRRDGRREAVNTALSPTDEELAWARTIRESVTSGGVAVVDGAMIDPPVLARAAQILARVR
ncbi:hypothetical protein [Aeromicrobium yanjiei]|uniref:HpcH/HpaI aldolase/citrate lyase domain-containing protein n=1 Tax=Aeromicrobium yanjiei TaxID=2662028 RepID=A0A5Q2MBU3_9ACTN|nr:hypothetical protein [Aeromicrobium yanjiei]QGG40564.1 hypothetical protein GEV26_03850 [Aeromicrobium yanjiei]